MAGDGCSTPAGRSRRSRSGSERTGWRRTPAGSWSWGRPAWRRCWRRPRRSRRTWWGELGVFSMTGRGLAGVPNPSAVFLAARAAETSGSAVTALMEGTRPVLVEVQALAAPSGYGTPQRIATGLDPKRLAVLLAVLE